ncbi:hypothetical protein Acr_28g0012890 [Actinidia rufa]|uniref:Uncharacterized protein n=1 Tax=Actinidia rufa TaxID=165716 RepID=A0A7J0HCZ1_9ERIC|nr:hypothetical protein Acr_28g0012890 [Actinidia rufa]
MTTECPMFTVINAANLLGIKITECPNNGELKEGDFILRLSKWSISLDTPRCPIIPKGSSKLAGKSPGSDSVCRIPAKWSWVHQKVTGPGYHGRFLASDVNDEADPPLIYARTMEMLRRVTCVVSGRRLGGPAAIGVEKAALAAALGLMTRQIRLISRLMMIRSLD